MNIVFWILQGLLALLYLSAGGFKALQPAAAQQRMAWAKRRSQTYIRNVGLVEVLGALGLILPWATGILPWLTPLAALGLTVVQVLAIFQEHLPLGETKVIPANVVLGLLSLAVVVGRGLGIA